MIHGGKEYEIIVVVLFSEISTYAAKRLKHRSGTQPVKKDIEPLSMRKNICVILKHVNHLYTDVLCFHKKTTLKIGFDLFY